MPTAALALPERTPPPAGPSLSSVAATDLEVFSTARVLVDRSAASDPSRNDGGLSHHIPLFDRHVARLVDGVRALAPEQRKVAAVDDAADWQRRVSEAIDLAVEGTSEGREAVQRGGDLRLKVSVAIASRSMRVEVFPFPKCPFRTSLRSLPAPQLGGERPRIALSARPLSEEETRSRSLLVKTSDRAIYVAHTATLPVNGEARLPPPQSVLLYVVRRPTAESTGAGGEMDQEEEDPEEALLLTETTIANVFFLPPPAPPSPGERAADDDRQHRWLTPRLDPIGGTPFLAGLQRAALLAQNEVDEVDLSLAQAKRWTKAGGRVACANALRGVWEVELRW